MLNFANIFGTRKLESLGSCDDIYCRTPTCDGQTDRQTDGSIYSARAVKTTLLVVINNNKLLGSYAYWPRGELGWKCVVCQSQMLRFSAIGTWLCYTRLTDGWYFYTCSKIRRCLVTLIIGYQRVGAVRCDFSGQIFLTEVFFSTGCGRHARSIIVTHA